MTNRRRAVLYFDEGDDVDLVVVEDWEGSELTAVAVLPFPSEPLARALAEALGAADMLRQHRGSPPPR